ncbi:MAG: hypothetical protein IPP74_05230 [Alphaproteobacteria bacterium]|nr:hypothetical protein [Alphaproteobacteria bacterium]
MTGDLIAEHTPESIKEAYKEAYGMFADGAEYTMGTVDSELRLLLGDAEVDALYDYVGAKKDAAGNWLYDQFTPDQLHAIIGFGAVFLAPAFAPEKAVASAAATEMGELANNIKVIGRLTDTEVAKDWVGHEVLDIPEWSIEKNMQWVDSGIKNQQNFYLASPLEDNLLQSSGLYSGEPTIMALEIEHLENAGYVKMGNYFVHPSNISIFNIP